MNDNLTDQQQAGSLRNVSKIMTFVVASFGIAISGVFGLQYYQEAI